MTGRRGERGAATTVAVSFLGVLVLVGVALGVVGGMLVAHRTAQAAADLAALAGAGAIADGGDPCAAAARVAAVNGARLDACSVLSAEVTVEVAVAGPRWLGRSDELVAQARAGPG